MPSRLAERVEGNAADEMLANLRLPVVCAPMFLVSGPELVIAQCKAGVVGSFPSLNARPEAELGRWIDRIESELADYRAAHPGNVVAPYAVNLVVHPTNKRLEHDLDECVERRVPIIITSLSAPVDVVPRVHAYGGLVFHDVVTVRHARKAAMAGVDGLILVCAGAGGHGGTLSPFALLSEVREFFQATIILAGAISRGEHVLAARAMGADLAYMGTRFIASREADAAEPYKQMVVDSQADDILYTDYFSGLYANYLKPSIVSAGLDPAQLMRASEEAFASHESKPKAWSDIWGAGQGVGNIKDMPDTSDIVDRIERELRSAEAALNAGRAHRMTKNPRVA